MSLAHAHHDGGAALPVALNVPGNVAGLSIHTPQTRFGLSSRLFRVTGHPLYGPLTGGDATVLVNALYGMVGLGPRFAAEALLPIISDFPAGAGHGHTGLADVRLGLRAFVPMQTLGWSAAVETSVPTGSAEHGFGADAFVSRLSTRLAYDVVQERLRVFTEAGIAWAWDESRGTMADVALAAAWQTTRVAGLYVEARVLAAVEQGRDNLTEVGGRSRAAGDTSVVLTPAVTLALTPNLTLAAGPQFPLGFEDFAYGAIASLTYRP
ncbi:MAG: hypothetical protein SF187_29470 [Deltaproteobacteria bacterium]|nr:hypothetical protein [Deltaproteobacteria bacterium]